MPFYYAKIDENRNILSAFMLMNAVNEGSVRSSGVLPITQPIYQSYMSDKDVYSFKIDINGQVSQEIKIEEIRKRLKDLANNLAQNKIFAGFTSGRHKFKCDLITQQNIIRHYAIRDLIGTATIPSAKFQLKDSNGETIKFDKAELKTLARDMHVHIERSRERAKKFKERIDIVQTKLEADALREEILSEFSKF